MIDALNQAVKDVGKIPRVRFEADIPDGAHNWLRKKHADGAVHEPGTIAAFLAVRERCWVDTIFDVGALYGYFSLLCSQMFPNADITAFEMHPYLIDLLKLNVGPDVKIVQAAVSDSSKDSVDIWINGFNIFEEPADGWDALPDVPGAMKPRGKNNQGRGFAKTPFLALDDYCKDNPAPDLIKIDVEGYQAKAIEGCLWIISLKRQNPPAIIIELHDPEKLARFGVTNKQTVQPLFDAGYLAYWCGNFRSPEAVFESVTEMGDAHEKLSLMVFVP